MLLLDAPDTGEAWDALDSGMLEMPGMLCMLRCFGCAAAGNLDPRMLWTSGCSRCWGCSGSLILQMLGMLWTPRTQLFPSQTPLCRALCPTELSSAAGAVEQPRGESRDAPSPGRP